MFIVRLVMYSSRRYTPHVRLMDIPSYREKPARHLINNAPGWPCRLDLVSKFSSQEEE
jgi:hypothetical protein